MLRVADSLAALTSENNLAANAINSVEDLEAIWANAPAPVEAPALSLV
jgi:hypothetical protein